MALKAFGNPENDKGEWVDFGLEKLFRIRVRRIPTSVAQKIQDRHKGKLTYEVHDGIRKPVKDMEQIQKILEDKAAWAWTDAEGLAVTIEDEEASNVFGGEVGEDVDISGEKLTDKAKRFIMNEISPGARVDIPGGEKTVELSIAVFILKTAQDQQQAINLIEEEAAKNS